MRAEGGPAGQHTVRRHNLGLALGAVAAAGEASRAEISARTGLTKATAAALVGDLLALGLVEETGTPAQGSRGRPSRPLRLAPDGVVAIGAQVGVDALGAVAVDLAGRVRATTTVAWPAADRTPARTARRLAEVVRRLAATVPARHLVGCEVGVPGLVDRDAGVVRVAPNLGWSDVPLADLLSRHLDGTTRSGAVRSEPVGSGPAWSVRLDNEAHLCALGERDLGRTRATFLHVSVDVGVGAGMVVDGALYRGAHGFGGELGHFPVDPTGPPCACGNRGCLEVLVGRDAPLTRAALGGDPEGLAGLADALGTGIGAAVNFFDPEAVVLGGTLAPLADRLADPLTERWRATVLGSRWAEVAVVASRLGGAPAAQGGALAAAAAVVADPLRVGPGGRLSTRGTAAAASRRT